MLDNLNKHLSLITEVAVIENSTIPHEYTATELDKLPENWSIVRIREVVRDCFGGGTPSTNHPDYWDGDIPWTTTAIINPEDLFLEKYQRKITEIGLNTSSSHIAPKGSILFGSRVGVGKSVIALFDIAINQDLTALIPNEKIVPEFFVYQIKSSILQSAITEKKRGTTIKGIHRTDLLNLKISLPPLSEQHAITNVLLTVQLAKERTDAVIAATKSLKTAMMKHLFTYGPVPPEEADKVLLKQTEIGQVPEEWNLKSLLEIATLQRGKDLPKQNQIPGPYPIIGSAGIMGYHKEYICEGPGVVTGRSGTIGKLHYIEGPHWPHNTGLYVKDFHGNVPKFIFYLISLVDFKKYSSGVSVPTLNRNFIHNTILPVPSITTQQQIIYILSSIDQKLAVEQSRKEALDTLFISLLNDLMTVKIRVKSVSV